MKKNFKKICLIVSGSFILVLGIALILLWWVHVVFFFRGIIGMLLALTGLIILFFIKD